MSQGASAAINFEDADLDPLEIGGTVTWTPAGDVSLITNYNFYLAVDENGTSRSELLTKSPAWRWEENPYIYPDQG